MVEQPTRRRFTAAYKRRILAEAESCTEPGEVGRLLRREGLYSSHLSRWRRAAETGALKALSKKRGPKPKRTNPLKPGSRRWSARTLGSRMSSERSG